MFYFRDNHDRLAVKVFLSFVVVFTGLMFQAPNSARGQEPTKAGREARDRQWFDYDSSLPLLQPLPQTTRWARPYSRGKATVLFFVTQNPDVNVRPTRFAVELLQRFDLDGTGVRVQSGKATAYAYAYLGGAGIAGGKIGLERLERVMKESYDCYVFDHAKLIGMIPEKTRQEVFRRVKAGAGLVVLGTGKDKTLEKDVTLIDAKPPFLNGAGAKLGRLGKGRVLLGGPALAKDEDFATTSSPAVMFGWATISDLYYEKLGRCLIWAVDKVPAMTMTFDSGLTFPAGKSAQTTLRWENQTPNISLELSARIRSRVRGPIPLAVSAGAKGQRGRSTLTLPALPAGNYVLDFIARDGSQVHGWSTADVIITTKASLTAPALDVTWGKAGSVITGSVSVNPAGLALPVLRVRVLDRYGRSLAQQDLTKLDKSNRFALRTTASMPGMVWVEAVLLSHGREIVQRMATYMIPRRGDDKFSATVWGRLYGNSISLPVAEAVLARAGVTARLETSERAWWYMTAHDMTYVPMIGNDLQRQAWGSERKGPDRGRGESSILVPESKCWNDEPSSAERLYKWFSSQHQRQYGGVYAYNMGDEKETLGACMNPACWRSYQLYLQREYGTIAALNQSWGTTFRSFAQVKPRIDNTAIPWIRPEKARKAKLREYASMEVSSLRSTSGSTAWNESWKNYPRWFDRRAFMAENFARYVKKFGRVASEFDPQARFGLEGTLWLDDDIDIYVRNSNWVIPYSHVTGEIVRSIAPKSYRYGFWSSLYWQTILCGADIAGIWRVDNLLGPHGEIAASGGHRDMFQQMGIIFDGLGTLLNVDERTTMEHDGIAILHSFASAQAVVRLPEPGGTYGTYAGWTSARQTHDPEPDWAIKPGGWNHLSWHRAIRSLGLDFKYVTDRMLRLGEFKPEQYKVIVLSQCEAIGAKEGQVIRQFVKNGGTVIADVRPGLYDGHCKPQSTGMLDDLFGIKHTGNVKAVKADGSIHGQLDGKEVTATLADLYVNPAVELDGARALGRAGQTPIAIVNDVGKGRAILLNFTMNSFTNLSLPRVSEDPATFLETLFAQAGVTWPLRLRDEAGQRMRNLQMTRWRTGKGLEVLALFGPLDYGYHLTYRPSPSAPGNYRHRGGWSSKPGPSPVQLVLPEPKVVTVIGGEVGLKPVHKATIQVRPNQATFVVLSDQAIGRPILRPRSKRVAQGQLGSLWVALPAAQGLHALKIRVTTPKGEPAPWYDQTVIVDEQGTTVSLPIAYNEQPGPWTVTATDLYTNQTATTTYGVTPAATARKK